RRALTAPRAPAAASPRHAADRGARPARLLLCGAVKKPQPQETTHLGRCVELLESIALDPTRLASVDEVLRRRLVTAAGQVSRPDKLAKRAFASALWRRERDDRRRHDTAILERTGTRVLRRASVYPTPLPGATAAPPPRKTRDEELYEPRKCYVCKVTFNRVHFFYDSMCPSCADLNWTKRHQTADVAGRVAAVTGRGAPARPPRAAHGDHRARDPPPARRLRTGEPGRTHRGGSAARTGHLPGGAARRRSPAGRSPRPEQLAAHARGGPVRGAPGSAPRERGRAVRPERPAEAAHAEAH